MVKGIKEKNRIEIKRKKGWGWKEKQQGKNARRKGRSRRTKLSSQKEAVSLLFGLRFPHGPHDLFGATRFWSVVLSGSSICDIHSDIYWDK